MNGPFRLGSIWCNYCGFNSVTQRGNTKMIRYTFFVLTVLGTAATAIAAIAPNHDTNPANAKNVTVIEKKE
jgi:hypothetical protein